MSNNTYSSLYVWMPPDTLKNKGHFFFYNTEREGREHCTKESLGEAEQVIADYISLCSKIEEEKILNRLIVVEEIY